MGQRHKRPEVDKDIHIGFCVHHFLTLEYKRDVRSVVSLSTHYSTIFIVILDGRGFSVLRREAQAANLLIALIYCHDNIYPSG